MVAGSADHRGRVADGLSGHSRPPTLSFLSEQLSLDSGVEGEGTFPVARGIGWGRAEEAPVDERVVNEGFQHCHHRVLVVSEHRHHRLAS